MSNAGVYGNSQTGPGVRVDASTNVGVFGSSNGSYAVFGVSANSVGVVGQTTNGVGVYGIGNSGTAGRFDGAVVVNGDFSATGMKSAVVVAADGVQRRLYCMESPDSWFEDANDAELRGGSVVVKFDPIFASVVDLRDCHIFLTPKSDCNGLFVSEAERTGNSFTVRELRGGTSNTRFSYRILARRRDLDVKRGQPANLPQVTRPSNLPDPNNVPMRPNVAPPPNIPEQVTTGRGQSAA